MFPYYGCKKRLARYYPLPLYNTIIEPFCGAANYSLYGSNWKKNVFLYDIDSKIVAVWNYLINEATQKRIMELPLLKIGEDIRNYKWLEDVERWLIGFYINIGVSSSANINQKWGIWNYRSKLNICKNLFKIKHWKVYNMSYENIENMRSTWFIDPPYQKQGIFYKHGSSIIDYRHLSAYCKSRKGQVIVCENKQC